MTVATEVEKVVEEVKKEVEKVFVEITAEEKLLVRNIENEFLKAQMEAQRVSTVLKNKQEQFTKLVEEFVKKYAVDPAVYVFDSVELIFKKK